jgi:hypothetical protein
MLIMDAQNIEKSESIKIEVDSASAMVLKQQEFDKKIAEAEALVSNLKLQKATFLYETNLQVLVNKHKANQVPITVKN